MLQKILVPLDGSELAEAVISYVEEICRRCDPVEVVLLQAISPPSRHSGGVFRPQDDRFPKPLPDSQADVQAARHPIYREQEIASARSRVEAELTPVVQRLSDNQIPVRIAVVFGRPADEIVDFAEREGIDLIAMSTHGRSGMSRWILGSVADKVLHGTHLPILLVRPHGMTGAPFPPQAEIEI